MRPGTKVYMVRIVFAVMAGLLSTIINPVLFNLQYHGIVASLLPIIIAIFLYVTSYYFAKNIVKVDSSSLNDPSYMYKGGIFTYIFVWIVTWSIAATLCYPSLAH